MARKFERIDEWEVFVPDIADERDMYTENPDNAMSCEIRYLSAKDAKKYERIWHRAKGQAQAIQLAEESAKRMFLENVRNVRNYAPNGRDLRMAEDVWDEGEPHIINAITEGLQDRSKLEDGLGKRLRSGSGSLHEPPQTSANGGAPAATLGRLKVIPPTRSLATPREDSPTPLREA